MKVGDAVKQFRNARGLSMGAFAKLSGLSKAYISLLEKGVNNQGEKLVPSITTLRKIANAMGADVNDLIDMLDEDSYITIEEPMPLIYVDNDFEIYSSSRRLPESAEPFLKKTLLSMTEPLRVEEPTPTRAEILNWLAEHVRTAAYGGSNYEDFSDEDLLAFYLDIRKEAESDGTIKA